MPLNRLFEYSDNYPPVVANAALLVSSQAVQFDATLITAFEGAYGIMQRFFRPGTFASRNAAGTHRPLPRTRVTAVNDSASTALVVDRRTSNIFTVGEVLQVIAPSNQINLTGGWANGSTLTVTIAGQAATYTETAFVDIATTAVSAANALNFGRTVGVLAEFRAEGDQLHLYAADMKTPHAVAVAATGGTAALAVAGGALVPDRVVGTIAAIATTTDTDPSQLLNSITLAANSAIRLPAGMPIGVAGWNPTAGLVCPQGPPNPEWDSNTEYGAYESGVFYRDRLPYWDAELAALVPKVTLV